LPCGGRIDFNGHEIANSPFLLSVPCSGWRCPASAQNPQRHGWIHPPSGLPKAGHGEPVIKLDTLFDALKIAPDDDSAKAIEERIWAVWVVSGSDTCNLLMSRVKPATDDKNYDLALKAFGAVIAISPKYVEAWNQRATSYYLKDDYGHALADLREGAGARAAPLRRVVRASASSARHRRRQARARSLPQGAGDRSHLEHIPDVVKNADREGRGTDINRDSAPHNVARRV